MPPQVGQVKDAPSDHHVDHQCPDQRVALFDLDALDAATGLEHPVENLDVPAPEISAQPPQAALMLAAGASASAEATFNKRC